jgi:ABC-2 type transport system ATP-binding protein
MKPVFRLDHIVKRYGRQTALADLSLESPAGQVVALLGDNGAGKTTALRILLGLIEPDEGRSEVLGMDSRRHGEEIRRRVGYVPERPTLYTWMTVAEIGWFAAGFYPSGYLSKYQELVRGFQLPLDRKLKALSKGMLAKVSLALAMAHEPELLVLDEPTSGLDPLVRREFLESMVEVAAAGRTVLLSSHQLAEVERVADAVAVLKQGQLVLYERLDDLKSRIRELTVTFVNGSSQLPALPGTLIRSDGEDRQRRFLIRDLQEGDLETLRGDAQVRHVEVHHPSLEEIFVGYLRGDPQETSP